jgi:hypothetical protein
MVCALKGALKEDAALSSRGKSSIKELRPLFPPLFPLLPFLKLGTSDL